MKRTVHLYDTTLRDGCQAEDVTLTLDDKLRITERLDAFGVRYVEGGWPGSNPRDEEYFRAVKRAGLRHAKIAAFGPDALVVSLGVDTFERDPISRFKLRSEDYLRIGEIIAALNRPTLFVMEGGYAVEEIGINAVNVLTGFQQYVA